MRKHKANERLKIIRESFGWSREKLAKKLGVSPQVVANMELGRKQIYADDLDCLGRIFNMTTDQFLGNKIKINMELSLVENELIDLFRSVSESAQELIIHICKDIVEFEETEESETIQEPKFVIAASGGENATDEQIKEAIELAKNL